VDLRAVNRRVVESFIKSGSFDTLDPRRASLFAALDRAMESGVKGQRDREQGQSSLFGGLDQGAQPAPVERVRDVPEWGEGERLAYEKESLGFFITGHPLERFRKELEQWATATTGRLMEVADGREVSVGGIITGLRPIKTRKGERMASFVLEDLEGGVEALVFPETYKKVGERLADDLVVLVKGKAEILDEGKARVLISEVLPLDQAKLAEARFVTIRVPVPTWDRAKGERLRDILGSHRGECPVTLEMVDPGAFAVAVAPSTYFRVRPDAAFRDEVEALLGPGSLVLARRNGDAG
jgi:DNA polymerase-3 subunit alpha